MHFSLISLVILALVSPSLQLERKQLKYSYKFQINNNNSPPINASSTLTITSINKENEQKKYLLKFIDFTSASENSSDSKERDEFYSDLLKKFDLYYSISNNYTLSDIQIDKREDEFSLIIKKGLLNVISLYYSNESVLENTLYSRDLSFMRQKTIYKSRDTNSIFSGNNFRFKPKQEGFIKIKYKANFDDVIEFASIFDFYKMSVENQFIEYIGNGELKLIEEEKVFVGETEAQKYNFLIPFDFDKDIILETNSFSFSSNKEEEEEWFIEFYELLKIYAEDPINNLNLLQKLSIKTSQNRRLFNHILSELKSKILQNIYFNHFLDILINTGVEDYMHTTFDFLVYQFDPKHAEHSPELIKSLDRVLQMIAYNTFEGEIIKAMEWLYNRFTWFYEKDSEKDLIKKGYWLMLADRALQTMGALIKRQATYRGWFDRQARSGIRKLHWLLDNQPSLVVLVSVGNSGLKDEFGEKVINLMGQKKEWADVCKHTLRRLGYEIVEDVDQDEEKEEKTLSLALNPINVANQLQIVGNEKFGAVFGYELHLSTFAKFNTYSSVTALNKVFPIFNLESVLASEGYIFISIGDVLWSCVDVYGSYCSKNSTEFISRAISVSARLFKFPVRIPLVFGVSLGIDIGVVGRLEGKLLNGNENKEIKGLGFNGLSGLVGVDLVAESCVDLFFARGGVFIEARMLYTEFELNHGIQFNKIRRNLIEHVGESDMVVLSSPKRNDESEMSLIPSHTRTYPLGFPIAYCATLDIKQNPIGGVIRAYAQIRNEVVRCGRRQIPCWLNWGSKWEWQKIWDGFGESVKWERRVFDKCWGQ